MAEFGVDQHAAIHGDAGAGDVAGQDGNGFDPRQPSFMRGGLGLLTMRERAAMAGGKLSIISSPGKGTQLRVVVDLVQEHGMVYPRISC